MLKRHGAEFETLLKLTLELEFRLREFYLRCFGSNIKFLRVLFKRISCGLDSHYFRIKLRLFLSLRFRLDKNLGFFGNLGFGKRLNLGKRFTENRNRRNGSILCGCLLCLFRFNGSFLRLCLHFFRNNRLLGFFRFLLKPLVFLCPLGISLRLEFGQEVGIRHEFFKYRTVNLFVFNKITGKEMKFVDMESEYFRGALVRLHNKFFNLFVYGCGSLFGVVLYMTVVTAYEYFLVAGAVRDGAELVAHTVFDYHVARDTCCALYVVGGARGDVAEDYRLRDAAAEQCDKLVKHMLL